MDGRCFSANELTAKLLIEIPKKFPGCRAWRMNQGGAYPIQTIAPLKSALQRGDLAAAQQLALRCRPLHFGGPDGLPDIDGLTMDGRRLGIEVKFGRDKQSDDQQTCQRVYEERGAIYVVARDVEGCLEELGRRLTPQAAHPAPDQ